jgi:hypothetical protein
MLLGLTWLKLWQRQRPTWLAKDIIVLFYEESSNDYG